MQSAITTSRASASAGVVAKSGIEPRREKRPWLLTDFDADVWEFAFPVPGNARASVRINWKYPIGPDAFLTDPQFAAFLEAAKFAVWWYMESELTRANRTSSAREVADELRRIACWAIIERRATSFADLEPADFKAFEKYVRRLRVAVNSAHSKLLTLRLLWILREMVPRSLRYDPFPGRGGAMKVAREVGKRGGLTPVISIRPTFQLLDFALSVLERADETLQLRDERMLARAQIEGKFSSRHISRLVNEPATIAHDDLVRNLSVLYGSAIIILLVFTAIRKHEAAAITLDDFGVAEAEELLTGRVRKTSKTPTGQRTERPLHPTARMALRIIGRLTAPMRSSNERRLLLLEPFSARLSGHKDRMLHAGTLYRLFDAVLAASGVELNVERLRPHQLRKFYFLLYAWRFEIGDLETLRRHAYHGSIWDTARYCSDAEFRQFLSEADQELAVHIMEEALMGTRGVTGGFGDRLTKMRLRLRKSVHVLSPERLRGFVVELVEQQGITLKPFAHGYCAMSRARRRLARCSRDGAGPDYAWRTDKHCSQCGNFLVHSGFLRHWELQRDTHTKVALDSKNPPFLVKVARDGVALAKRMIGRILKAQADAQT